MTRPEHPVRAAGMALRIWLPAGVGLLTAAVFRPALRNEFVVWDDDINLTANAAYRGLSWSHLAWMLTTTHGGHWHPLTWLTFALDHRLWGMSPVGYHLTNVFLHATNAVLVFLLVRALLRHAVGGREPARLGITAAAGALFFALHPLRVESVAWATERRDVLSGVFYLLTLLAYLRLHEPGGTAGRWYAATLGCFALSLAAKAWGITLPVVLLALDAYPLRRLRSRAEWLAAMREKIPFALLALGATLLAANAVRGTGLTRTLAEHGVLARLAQAAYGLCFYVRTTLLPLHLSPLYRLPEPFDPGRAVYLGCALAVGAAAFAVVRWRTRWPWAFAAATCYAVIASPVLGLAQSGPQIAADRYTYLAGLPFAVVFAAGVYRALGTGAPRVLVGAATAGVLVALGAATVRQIEVWRSSETLWGHVLTLDPECDVAYTQRGVAREVAGDLPGAIADYGAAIRLAPERSWQAFYGRGNTYLAQNDPAAAIADYTSALGLDPGTPEVLVNRANARRTAGDRAGAALDYVEALRVAPADWEYRAAVEAELNAVRPPHPPR